MEQRVLFILRLLKRDVKHSGYCESNNETSGTAYLRNVRIDNQSKAFTFDEAEQRLAEYDLIIQTTSIGMNPNIA